MNKIFLIAGRTGGPIMPTIAIADNLQGVEPVIIGIKGGFEDKVVAKERGWKIEYVPEAKLYFLSFSKKNLYDYISEFFRFVGSIVKLIYSFLKSVYLAVKHKPKMIIGAGSFLSIPVISAIRVTNLLRITKTKIIIHQQDPTPGLSNKLTIKSANLKTCVYEGTKKYKNFQNCQTIPNPLDTKKFDSAHIEESFKKMAETNTELYQFLTNMNQSKPLFLIFGGGSGSRFINTWVSKNVDKLLERFNVIHLKGTLQEEYNLPENSDNYLLQDFLAEEYSVVMKAADLVLCRAGMSSITELLFLRKPAILVPLFNSHQEDNVKNVEDYFAVFKQRKDDLDNWVDKINKIFPEEFKRIDYPSPTDTKEKLSQYYSQVQDLLEE